MYIGDWLGRRETLSPNKVALLDAQRDYMPITYREWNRQANRTARWLAEIGVRQGDLVAVLSMNCVEYLDIWFACGKLGAVMQTLNWRLATAELVALLKDVTPRVLVYGPDFVSQVQAIQAQVPEISTYVAIGDRHASSADLSLSDRAACPDAPLPPVELTWDSPWVLCYTGGTTGLPKAAILTHGNIAWNSINTIVSWGLLPTDRTFLNSPMFHTGGLNVLTAPLVHIGGTSIVCREVNVDQMFDLIEKMGVTIYFGVPTMFIAQQAHPRWESADFSRLRWVISGGAPCPPPVFEKWWARGVDFKMGYGLTESGPNTFWMSAENARRKPGSVGVPMFHVDVKVVRPDGSECAPNELGELYIRGPHIVPGYRNRPEESRKALEGGWLHTGDLARYDSEGFYYIVGRSKEMFISGGENIYPAEVEAVMSGHPAVASVAVIGVPDDHWGEVGRAIVVLKPGAEQIDGTLLDYCRERLARYKVPKSIVYVDALPTTGAGKVDKRLLAETYGGAK